MPPVTARVARARAAILVLIDIGNSIRLNAARCGPHARWTEPLLTRFESQPGNMASWVISQLLQLISWKDPDPCGRLKACLRQIYRHRRATRRTRRSEER